MTGKNQSFFGDVDPHQLDAADEFSVLMSHFGAMHNGSHSSQTGTAPAQDDVGTRIIFLLMVVLFCVMANAICQHHRWVNP